MELKEVYLKRREAQLNQWDAEIRKLMDKAEHDVETLPLEFNKHLRTLRETRMAAEIKLSELKHSTVDTWDEFYSEVEHLWQEFESSLTDSRTKSLQCQLNTGESQSADNRPQSGVVSVADPNSRVAPRD